MSGYNIPSASINGYRGLMVYLGLASPLSRAFVAGASVAAIQYVTKTPSAAFDEDGAIRQWSLVFPQSPEATDQHFLILPIGVASAVYLFT
tara:strand:+ start:57 stop:329 length:273 start_codon:yes stop_codon:yes gene_type:complete